jgi:hypothetical protein
VTLEEVHAEVQAILRAVCEASGTPYKYLGVITTTPPCMALVKKRPSCCDNAPLGGTCWQCLLENMAIVDAVHGEEERGGTTMETARISDARLEQLLHVNRDDYDTGECLKELQEWRAMEQAILASLRQEVRGDSAIAVHCMHVLTLASEDHGSIRQPTPLWKTLPLLLTSLCETARNYAAMAKRVVDLAPIPVVVGTVTSAPHDEPPLHPTYDWVRNMGVSNTIKALSFTHDELYGPSKNAEPGTKKEKS